MPEHLSDLELELRWHEHRRKFGMNTLPGEKKVKRELRVFLSLYVDKDLRDDLRREAIREGVTVSKVVNAAIEFFLAARERTRVVMGLPDVGPIDKGILKGVNKI